MIRIKNATKKGYIPIIEGGVLNLSLPNSKTRRGRVIDNGTICPTLDTGCEVGVLIVDDSYKNRPPRFYKDAAPTIRAGGGQNESHANRTDIWH